MKINATIKDIFYKQKKQAFDSNYASKTRVKSTDSVPIATNNYQPYDNIVSDPVLELSRAEEAFHSYQVSSGFEIYKNGQVETAADEANIRAFQESEHGMYGTQEAGIDMRHDTKAPGYPSIYDRPLDHRMMPGPGFGPAMGPMDVINMCMGGW